MLSLDLHGRYTLTSFVTASTQRELAISVGYRNITAGNSLCQYYAGPMKSRETRRFDCDNPIYGRFVFIQRIGNTIEKVLCLCEVKVFGDGQYIKRTLIARLMGPTWGLPGSCRPQVGSTLTSWALVIWGWSLRQLRPIHYACKWGKPMLQPTTKSHKFRHFKLESCDIIHKSDSWYFYLLDRYSPSTGMAAY